jgi:hypothetical protein
MAKYIIEYNVCVGDEVRFERMDGIFQYGVVQDVSCLPDVFVEGFDMGEYKRWRIGVDKLDFYNSSRQDAGEVVRVEISRDENVEFVHCGDVGTDDFGKLKYRKMKSEVDEMIDNI